MAEYSFRAVSNCMRRLWFRHNLVNASITRRIACPENEILRQPSNDFSAMVHDLSEQNHPYPAVLLYCYGALVCPHFNPLT